MSSIYPEGENVRKAVKWISDHRQDEGGPSLKELIHQAINRFDLTPLEGQFLVKFYKDAEKDAGE